MTHAEYILKSCQLKLQAVGMPDHAIKDISSMALSLFRRHELKNAKDINKFLEKHVRFYQRSLQKLERDPIKRH
jgi:hypothetical protein